MTGIQFDTETDKYLISIEKTSIDKGWIVRLLENLRMEELAKQLNFDSEIEKIGEDIKASWWKKNKSRFINE